MSIVAEALGMDMVDLDQVTPAAEIMELIPEEQARARQAFPVHGKLPGTFALAVCDPWDTGLADDLNHLLGREVTLLLAAPGQIRKAIRDHYGDSEVGEGKTRQEEGDRQPSSSPLEYGAAEAMPSGDHAGATEATIINYVHRLISEALRRRASDIHLEPIEGRFRIRCRVDGVLQEMESPPRRIQGPVLSRIKIMAGQSIAERRIPQDGRISVQIGDRDIDLRVSTIPTVHGESIAMRILDRSGAGLELGELGLFSDDRAIFENLFRQPDGIFLVTGPTGSGKTTTLYAAMNRMNHPDRKMITVEDPIEYDMNGVSQVPVRAEIGLTFAVALRSLLRQSPNIILVGEIRDRETAGVAFNASLTGHMVYSTLHTNDAPSAVSRLVNMGIKPFLISASLRGVMGQRLVRQVDPGHYRSRTPGREELRWLGLSPEELEGADFREGIPHASNGWSGYRGRKGIFEFLVVGKEIEQLIYRDATLVELRRMARELGMRTMREDGIRKVAAGITTVKEVLNVTVESPRS